MHRTGKRSRHNLNYWTFGDYLGIGAGAHSKLSFPERILRQARYRQPRGSSRRPGAGKRRAGRARGGGRKMCRSNS